MIILNDTIRDILNQPVIESFSMVELGNYKTTDYFGNINLSDGRVFVNDGKLLSVEPPHLSTVVDRAIYKISFADPNYDFAAEHDNYTGMQASVRLGFIQDEMPLLQVENTFLLYQGQVDFAAYNISTEDNGETVFVVECASPMANLDLVRTFYTSKENMRMLSPGDTSFDQVYEGSGQISLKWGKG